MNRGTKKFCSPFFYITFFLIIESHENIFLKIRNKDWMQSSSVDGELAEANNIVGLKRHFVNQANAIAKVLVLHHLEFLFREAFVRDRLLIVKRQAASIS